MYCPSCGLDERGSNQFCRACGTDLRIVRTAMEKTDSLTASAANAREEIGRAIADRIRETDSAGELKKVVEDVLPQVEKFLESPENRRLRRIRTGSLISFIGLGATIAFTLASVFGNDKGVIVIAAAGLVTMFIGLSFLINGMLFSIPQKSLADNSEEGDNQRQLDYLSPQTNELKLPEANPAFRSITDETTKHLEEKLPVSRS
jgi:hypothetical protein